MRDWEVIVLMDTWLEEKDWEEVRRRLPERYVWKRQVAKREKKKERASGGMILGMKKELVIKEKGQEKEVEGILTARIKYENGSWREVGVYIKGDMKKLKEMEERMEGNRDGTRTIIGGDFNTKTGEEGR